MVWENNIKELQQGGTEVKFLLHTYRILGSIPGVHKKKFSGILQWHWDLSTALLRVKLTDKIIFIKLIWNCKLVQQKVSILRLHLFIGVFK